VDSQYASPFMYYFGGGGGGVVEAPESTPCPTLTTHPASLKALPLVLDTYEAAVRVCRGLSAQGV
jgi:hypothetical protein